MSSGVPVLTYHAANVHGNDYGSNDHVALAEDLRLLHGLGWRVVSLDELLDWYAGASLPAADGRCVALTFDDGTDLDYRDVVHPQHGPQTGLFNILLDHRRATGAPVHATSFVIVSRQAHEVLDRLALGAQGWYHADWWREAQDSGLLSIECHSWDHLHPLLDEVAQVDNLKGDFTAVASFEDCERQVRQAGERLATALGGRRPSYYAYPWGQHSEYLARSYLPHEEHRHGFRAAFTTGAEAVRRSQSRWELPRFVCGDHWKSPCELQALLGRATHV